MQAKIMIPNPATAATGRSVLLKFDSTSDRKNLTIAAKPAIPIRTGVKFGKYFSKTINTSPATCRILHIALRIWIFIFFLLFCKRTDPHNSEKLLFRLKNGFINYWCFSIVENSSSVNPNGTVKNNLKENTMRTLHFRSYLAHPHLTRYIWFARCTSLSNISLQQFIVE